MSTKGPSACAGGPFDQNRMTFMVKYRGADGAVRTEAVEAASRVDCLAQMWARGIAPMNVRAEGSGGLSQKESRSSRKDGSDKRGGWRKSVAYVISVALVALFCGGVWWWNSHNEAPHFHKIELPKSALKLPNMLVPVPAPKVEDTPKSPISEEPPRPGKRRKPVRVEEVNQHIEKRYHSDGSVEIVVKPYALKSGDESPQPMFETNLENFLANFTDPGEDVIPLPDRFSDDEARRIIDTPINIDLDKDGDETITKKKAVMMLKEELRKAMDSGMTADEFANELQKRQAKEATQVNLSRKMIIQSIKSGNSDEARELMQKLNEHLGKQGIPPLVLPRKYMDAINNKTGEEK